MTYYYSKNSKRKIYHTAECCYAKRISEGNMKQSSDQDKLFRKGYTFCDHCSPAGKYLKANKAYLKKKPKKAKPYTIQLVDGEIEITSSISKYLLVFFEGKRMRLYHKNSFEVCDVETDVAGYHLQKEGNFCLAKTMKYIIEHDKYRKSHPVQYSPQLSERIRVESLLNSIPSEHFKVSDEKSERMKRIDSYHEHGNRQKPKKSGGGKGQRRRINQKKKQAKTRNAANANRVNALLALIGQNA